MTTAGRDSEAKNQYAYYNVPISGPDGTKTGCNWAMNRAGEKKKEVR